MLRRLTEQVQETLITLTGTEPRREPAHRRFNRARDLIESHLALEAEPLPAEQAHLAPSLASLEQTLFEWNTVAASASDETAFTLLEAPTRADEVRAALRWLKARHVHDGVRLSELAVLARELAPYRPVLQETAEEFGLPLKILPGDRLHENPAVAALLNLLALPAYNWPRRSVLEAWQSPYFEWSRLGIEAGDAQRLAAVAQHGQVIAGIDQWHETLNRLIDTPPRRADVRGEDVDEAAVRPPGAAPRGPAAAALRAKFDTVVARLTPDERATIRDYAIWVERLIDDGASGPAEAADEGSLGVTNRIHRGPRGESLPTATRDAAALQRLGELLRSLAVAETVLGDARPITYER